MMHAALLSAFLLFQAGAPARDPALPPAAEQAKAALDASPRHGEYVNVPMAGGPALKTWISYPERKDKAGVVIVIQEVFGLSDWLRGVADQLAKEGFIAVAPGHGVGLRAGRRWDGLGRQPRRRRRAGPQDHAGGGDPPVERRVRLGAEAPGRQRQDRRRSASAGAADRASRSPARSRRSPRRSSSTASLRIPR